MGVVKGLTQNSRAETAAKVWDCRATASMVIGVCSKLNVQNVRSEPGNNALVSSLPIAFRPPAVLRRQAGRSENQFHIAVYLTHVVFGVSQRGAGRMFGLDRTSVRYACARIEDARDNQALDTALDIIAAGLAAHARSVLHFSRQEKT